jgi:hypothetical protein
LVRTTRELVPRRSSGARSVPVSSRSVGTTPPRCLMIARSTPASKNGMAATLVVEPAKRSTAVASKPREMRCPGAVSSVKMRCRGGSRRERMGRLECSST